MTSGAKTVDPRSNLIGKHYWGLKRAIQCFFEFFLAIILLELIAIVCEKNRHFPKKLPLVTSGDLNINLNLK